MLHGATIEIFRNDTSGTPNAHSMEDVFSCSRRLSVTEHRVANYGGLSVATQCRYIYINF